MGKIKRGKKKSKKKVEVKVDMDFQSEHFPEEAYQAGRVINVTSQPLDEKGKKIKVKPGYHKIVEPKGNYRNTQMSVHVKDKKGQVVRIAFNYFTTTAKKKVKSKNEK